MKIESPVALDEKTLAELEAKIKDTKNKLEELVSDYPIASVAIAVGLGFVLAKVLERKR